MLNVVDLITKNIVYYPHVFKFLSDFHPIIIDGEFEWTPVQLELVPDNISLKNITNRFWDANPHRRGIIFKNLDSLPPLKSCL